MSASNDIKYQAKLPIATEAPRGRPAQ